MKHDSSNDQCWWYCLKSITAQNDLAEEGLPTDGRFSVGYASNKTPSHSQLLQTTKGHHMSLVVLSWQMTWLESKSTTDERGASKESRNIAPAHRIEWENLMKISSHQFRNNNNYRTKGYSSLTLKKGFCHCHIVASWKGFFTLGKRGLLVMTIRKKVATVWNIIHLLSFPLLLLFF